MIISFTGILLNTCCNNDNKNKTKKHWVVSVMSFNTITPLSEILKVSRQRVLLTNFSFQVLVLRNHIFFRFMDSTATFFCIESKHGAPSQDLTRLFFLLFPFLDAFLKKRMELPFWKSQVKCRILVGAHPI